MLWKVLTRTEVCPLVKANHRIASNSLRDLSTFHIVSLLLSSGER